MHNATLTYPLPTLPKLSQLPRRRGSWSHAIGLGLARALGQPVFVGPNAFRARRLMRFLEERVRAAEQTRRPILVGDREQPFDDAAPDAARGLRALLEILKRRSGLEVRITSRSPLLLRELDSLVELDQSHAVSIDVPIATLDLEQAQALDPEAPNPHQSLWMVRKLAEHGLTTRVVLPADADLGSEETLRPLAFAAAEHGAFDLDADLESTLLHRLRLEIGFPRPLPGRG